MDEEEDYGPKSIVIDNGSGMVKAGFAGEDHPSAVFSSIIGYPLYTNQMFFFYNSNPYFIGDDAQRMRGVCKIKYPIANGIIEDFDDMKKIWTHTFYNELRAAPSEIPVMITEANMKCKSNREQMCRIMFDDFNVPAMYIQTPAVLSIYAAGRTTGIVVESGDDVTHAVPIFEGHQIPDTINKIELAGRDLTSYLIKFLKDDNYNFETSEERESVRDMKEKLCYVADDYEAEVKKATEDSTLKKIYVLPDGTVCEFAVQRFKCPELLFHPELGGKELRGVHKLIYDSIMACDLDVRKDLYSNIILSGGSTMFENFGERLYKEVKALAPQSMKVKVIAGPDRKYAAWKGGAILSKLSIFAGMCVTSADYDEFGETVVHRKCY